MSGKGSNAQRAAVIYDGEDVERCRQARRYFEKRFKSLDEMFDYCERLRKRRGQARAERKARTVTKNSRPAHGRTVHKA